jgi:predicted TIM-barrel fold metal-dependent hydrolase
MTVDGHVHVASSDTTRYPLAPTGVGSDWWRGDRDVHHLLAILDGAGVAAAVVVQAVGAYGYDCAYAADAVAVNPARLALVGALDLDGPDPAGALARLVAEAPVRAVRVFGVGATAPAWLDDGRAEPVWAAAATAGIGIVPTLWDRDLPALRPLIEEHPNVDVAIDHCGFSDFSAGPPYAAAGALFDLADLPAVHLKVSSHVLEPLEDPADLVDELARRFGTDRLCWGSDYPQTQSHAYPELVELGRRACRRLDATGQEAFLSGTSRRLWFR